MAGYFPLLSARALVPEQRVTVDSVLASGYGEAKAVYAAEFILQPINKANKATDAKARRISTSQAMPLVANRRSHYNSFPALPLSATSLC
jgi:hypothetical protein